LASANVVTRVAGANIIQWYLGDSTGVNAATSSLYWWSTAGGDVTASGPTENTTESYWLVRTVTFIPSTAQSTGGYAQLFDDSTAGPILFRANMMTGEDVYSQTYDPPRRCRPVWVSTACANDFTAGAYWTFDLA
jgi:hypothetical protein